MLPDKRMTVHNKTRSTIAALEGKIFNKCLLNGGVLQPFNCVIFFPAASTASIKHDFIGQPSTFTVQAPQSPFKQPGFAPVKPSFFLNVNKSVSPDLTVTVRNVSFIFNTIVWSFILSLPLFKQNLHSMKMNQTFQASNASKTSCNKFRSTNNRIQKNLPHHLRMGLGSSAKAPLILSSIDHS